jgi:DNA-binding MarR family transcriptional regulator
MGGEVSSMSGEVSSIGGEVSSVGAVGDERSRRAARAWAALLAAHAALVPRLDQLLQQASRLPLSWYDVLLELAASPGGRLTMGELAQRVVLSRTRVSRVVTELETAGLVQREDNPDDGRSAFAVITADGLARYRAAAPRYLEAIEGQFAAGLTDAELDCLATALRKAAQQPIALTPRASL